MAPVSSAVTAIELEEVVAVVRHDRSPRLLRVLEEILVGEAPKFSKLADRFDIAPAYSKLLRHDR
jgi:hypothetical protein